MGHNRTITDSTGNEAKVTAALDALKVNIINTAGTTLTDLETTLDAIETLLGGTAKVKIWDGVESANVNASNELLVNDAQLATIESTLTNLEKALQSVNTDYLKVQMRDASDNLMPSMDVAARAGFQKVTDGTDTLDILKRGDTYTTPQTGIAILARNPGDGKAIHVPVARYTGTSAQKGDYVLPVVPMTGGREEGTFTRGFIPTYPVHDYAETTVANSAWVTVTTYTVTAGRTLHITDLVATYSSNVTFTAFQWRLRIAGTKVMFGGSGTGSPVDRLSSNTPIDVAAGVVVDLQVFHTAGGDRLFNANIIGFETVNSELD